MLLMFGLLMLAEAGSGPFGQKLKYKPVLTKPDIGAGRLSSDPAKAPELGPNLTPTPVSGQPERRL